ncbi:MAG: amino acid adenylation domain-containing protein [Bacteroidales bacterium]|nr:amino acid adenylation domain-containing protein [Bacteroidales bacterium]
MISPLSQAQLSIYLASQGLTENDGNYQLASLFKLPDSVDLNRLKQALEAVQLAHPYMLSRLVLHEGEPCMDTPDQPRPEVPVLTTLDRSKLARAMSLDPQNGGLLVRMELYRTPEGNFFYFDAHHILFDGASTYLFLQDLDKAFGGETLEKETFSGADVALKEQEQRNSDAFREAQEWYARTFGPGAETESRVIPDMEGEEGPYKELMVDLTLTKHAMQAVLDQYRYADSILFTTAFGLTLAAWNADDKAAFTSIWNGRRGLSGGIGMQVHTIPVYVDAQAEKPLKDILDALKDQTLGIRSRGFYSFADCARDLGLTNGINFGFQGNFVGDRPILTLGEQQIEGEDLRTNPPGIGLSIELFTAAEGPYKMRFWYRSGRYSEALLRSFAESFTATVLSMAKAETVRDLQYASAAQLGELDSFQPAEDGIKAGKTVLDLFKQQDPASTALVYKDQRLTYGQVDALSDRLAAYIEKNVGTGKVVSIMLGRNAYNMIAPLGVLKAGCAYQPLDPSYPMDRLQFMVKDAASALLIHDEGLDVEGFEGPRLATKAIDTLPEGQPMATPKADDLFVLLYTSGTTGMPKGCMLPHRTVSLFSQRHAANVGLNNHSRLTAYASFGFDAFVGDLFGALAAGAALYIVPEEIRLDLPALHQYFEENGITHAFMTTQVATQFAINFPQCKGLQVLYTGGEKLSTFPLPQYRLFNCYGPTESLCYTIFKEVQPEASVPIGKPLPGMHAYVVAKGGQRLPVGACGELLEAGEQVGDGYLGRPDKTAEAFASNPYEADKAYRRLYRTGDVVRYRADGDIEYIGRKDSQVKIRGFRIELKEVETVIREFEGIKDVTVQAFDESEGGGKFLAAYVVADAPVDIDKLNAFIAESKPPYMVPAITMQIDAIPLNVNQKVDKKALPKPQRQNAQKPAENAPLNLLEEEIAGIIRETAHMDGFGLTEPLMYYGLSSLNALRIATELYKKYGVQVDMGSFARTATLQSIENEVLKVLLSGERRAQEAAPAVTGPQELTFQQEGVYYDCMKAPHETLYNIPMLWRFNGDVTPEAVRDAALAVLKAHPSLNTVFRQMDGKVYAVPVEAEPQVSLEKTDGPVVAESFRETFVEPFKLSEGPLYRVKVLDTPDGVVLATDFHHLVFDGASYDIFGKQLSAALQGMELEAETFTYAQYAASQKAEAGSESYEQDKAFFARRLSGFEEVSEILSDMPAHEGKGKEMYVAEEVQAPGVAERCKQLGITPASYFLAATYMAVSAFTGKRKVYMCTVSSGRGNLKTAGTMGMFVNTLALCGNVINGPVEDYLKAVHADFSETLQHENYPFSQVAADFSFQPQIMLAYEVGVVEGYAGMRSEVLETGYPKFPVSIFVDGEEGKERFVVAYDDKLYSEGLMQNVARTLASVARGLLQYSKMEEVPFISDAQLGELDGFNHYVREINGADTIVTLFRKQAAVAPDNVAVAADGVSWTYSDVNHLTDRLASYLASQGLGREDVVSVLIGRDAWMVAASLGILKAGCAYQPLDASYPEERLNFMIKDAGAKLVIADEDLLYILKDYQGPVLKTKDILWLNDGPVPEGPAPGSLFVLLYTSGSTGVPKGVMLEHRNLVNFCAWYRAYYDLKPEHKVAAYASYGFDACMMDMYPALTTGATVYIIPEETRHDMVALDRFMADNGITHSFITTQVGVMFEKYFPENPSLKHLSVGGEKLVSVDPPQYAFHNGYGPTECTIFSTIFDVKAREENIPIGHPLDNYCLYVTDRQFRRLPVGAPGELIIAGAGVGRGYLNQPEKTAESFIDNPFCPGMRAYRSGDIVRYRPDGNIEFVGRRDSMVKIRGFRIETKEVEAVLREMPGVKDVTVQAFDKPSGGKFLAAYVVMEGTLDAKAAGAFIRERKPPYMVPESFNQIDRIPLNVNQKVDRRALPAPALRSVTEYVAPETPLEKTLCDIFASVLEMDQVGATDNFFDLGGTSLVVTNVLVAAQKAGLTFAYADVFSHPTARSLAAFLSGSEVQTEVSIKEYDYTAIHNLLAGNTLEAFLKGERQPLGKNILLTGVTGFLGIHILRELLINTPDDTIVWCLIRSRKAGSTTGWLKEMLVYYFKEDFFPLLGGRVRIIQGDITQPEVFQSILDSGTPIDLVINSAANVKHFSKGTDIEDVNYGGVKNIVAFCEQRHARLVHISTESVGGSTPGMQPVVFDEKELYFGQKTGNQYVHSKFLAERHILEHMVGGTINAKILRAGNLSPRASDGEFQMNLDGNAAMGRLKACKRLGMVPYASLTARMEFSPIDEAARAVVLLSTTPRETCVLHLSNNHLIPMEDVLGRLSLVGENPLQYVELEEFNATLAQAMNDPAQAPALSTLVAYNQAPDKEPQVINWPSTRYSLQILMRLGFHWSPTTPAYLDQMFGMLHSLNYFD